jgi:hypothetical protein
MDTKAASIVCDRCGGGVSRGSQLHRSETAMDAQMDPSAQHFPLDGAHAQHIEVTQVNQFLVVRVCLCN